MNQSTNYNLSLYEGTDLFNPLTVENVNFSDLDTIIKGVSDRAVSGATELLTGTVHAITRTDTDCDIFVFPATANYTAGETFTVDGVQVTALLPSGTTLPTGAYVIGSSVLCVLHGTLMTVLCDAGADAQTLQGHAASYFATDSDLDNLTTTVGNISTKVGSAVLTTTAPDCSGAINELNSKLSETRFYYSQTDVAGAVPNGQVVRTITVGKAGTYKVSWYNRGGMSWLGSDNATIGVSTGAESGEYVVTTTADNATIYTMNGSGATITYQMATLSAYRM
ncbi:MAG: hypothetical protein J5601_01365 [Elusimicrobiaceae bacterium]|nr:hypothetical protein [Elusimicrobiaceae bacterium]